MPDFGRWTSNGGDPSLNEINRADRFIDALASAAPVYSTDAAEAELAFLLSDWRDGVRDAPIAAPVTARDAVVALHGGLATRRRSRTSLALVGSVAAAMLCVGGFGAAVYGAGPGDSLYGMRTSLFGTQEATRDDQVSLASAQLQQVQQLIDQGQWQQAQDKLVEVSSAVQDVDQVESKQQLVNQWNALTYKVVEQNPAATLPPGEPLPPLPSSPLTWLPAPVVETTTTSAVTSTSDSSVTTTTSDSSVPSDVLSTSPPDTTTTGPSTTSSSATPPTTTTTTTVPPTTTTSTTVPPTTTTATTVPPTTTTVTSVAPTTTTRTVQPPPAASAEPPSPVASQPRLAPNPKPEVPAPASEPASSSPPKVPVTTSSSPPESQSGAGEGVTAPTVTTTTVPPR